ncbi:MAG: hypothetical protein ACJ8FY_03575 [Gemmataceae bacterium]
MPKLSNTRNRKRRAMVLIAVLIVVSVLSLAAYHYSELTMAEHGSMDSYRRSIQAHAAANSGIHYAAALLSDSNAFTNTLNSNPYDNSSVFQAQLVQSNDVARWQTRFGVIAPLGPDESASDSQSYHFGVVDESGKINLNALLKIDPTGSKGHDLLMTLPNMTEDVANAILDWLDPDDTPRESGAENGYYQSLSPPYSCKNGPLDSLEELLLVKGVTPQLLFGNDRNRNGMLEPEEDDGGSLDRGWSVYLTVYSHELNIDSQNNPRIYINDSDLSTLSQNLTTALGADLANYIIAYRLYGPAATGSGAGGGGGAGTPAGGGAVGAGMAGAGGGIPAVGTPGTGARAGTGGRPGGATSAPAAPAAPTAPARGATSGTAKTTTGAAPSVTVAPTANGNAMGPLNGADRTTVTGQLSRDRQGSQQKQLTNITSLYDLVNSSVSVPSGGGNAAPAAGGAARTTPAAGGQQTTINYPSPLRDPSQQESLLPLLLDSVTTTKATDLPGRINVNTAPQAVLASLQAIAPTLTANDIQAIMSQRPTPSSSNASDPIFQTPAWLVTRASIKPAVMKSLEKYITARTQVYRVQSVGYFDKDGPNARIEAIIDTNKGRPRILMWRDLTELGKGYDLQNSQ